MNIKLKKSSLLIRIVIAVLIVYAAVRIVTLRAKIETAESDLESLQEQVTQIKQDNAQLEYDIAHAGDDDTIEEIAREKLGLVLPGEKIFYDIGS